MCQEDKQCSSLKCIGGLCKAGVTEGQNCSFSFSSSLCDVSSSGVWSRCLFNTTTFTNTCQRLLSPNDVCSTYENLCPPWYFCAPDNATSSMGHCRMMYSLREGETCYSTRQCSSTLYCNNAGSAQYFGVCTSLPSQPPLCHQYCPAQSAGLQRCQCGGVNNQQGPHFIHSLHISKIFLMLNSNSIPLFIFLFNHSNKTNFSLLLIVLSHERMYFSI